MGHCDSIAVGRYGYVCGGTPPACVGLRTLLAVFLVLLGGSSVLATIGPAVKIRLPLTAEPALSGQPYSGAIEVVAGEFGALEGLTLEGEGWTIQPPDLAFPKGMQAGEVLRVDFAEVSNDFGTIPSMPATLTVSCAAVDFNCDGDVGTEDRQIFVNCVTGPNVPIRPPGCSPSQFDVSDMDNDGDVDQSDFGLFQRCYAGDGKPPGPNCGR